MVTELVLIGLYLLGLASGGGAEGQQAAALFVGGKYTTAFFALVIFGGLCVPLLLKAIEARRVLQPVLITPALILIGGLALRWIIVLAGQSPVG